MKKLIFTAAFVCCTFLLASAQSSQIFETRTVKSDILKMDRKYSIYLPAGYNESDQSYPVLYLLHGSGDDHTGWVQFGQVQHIADKTIAEGKAGPMIIVMPDANTGVKGYFNAIDGNFNYEDFFFKELIPHIEKTYRVRSERRYRAVAGLSMGGGGTIFYALHHSDMFAAAAPLSAATGNWDVEELDMSKVKEKFSPEVKSKLSDKQIKDYLNRHSIEGYYTNTTPEEQAKIKNIRWYISCGDDDFLYEGNSRMHILFRKYEIPHEYRVKDGGHTWTYWRMELPLVMEFVSKSFMQY